MGNHDAKEVIRAGYDAVSRAYRGDKEDGGCALYHAWLDELTPLLPQGSAVLDLGCGNGIPVARRLAAEGFAVTGVDFSPVQVERARRLVPQARFLCADMIRLVFPEGRFSAILSLYSIIHVPLEEQQSLFWAMRQWLMPGGALMAIVGSTLWVGEEQNWLGVPGATMRWSHADAATYESWLAGNGFHVRWTRFIEEGDGGHTLVLAQTPA